MPKYCMMQTEPDLVSTAIENNSWINNGIFPVFPVASKKSAVTPTAKISIATMESQIPSSSQNKGNVVCNLLFGEIF